MEKEKKQEFIIRVCCIIAAFVLWLFITSTENPVTAYKLKNIPVQLLNTEVLTNSNLILAPGQDLNVDLSIKGANTSILLDKKAEDFTIVADLSAYALKVGEQRIPIEIRTSPDNINVVNSESLFIKITLDQLVEAKLPINFNVSGKPKQGFFASEPVLSQKVATVLGGSKFVNIVKQILIEEDIQEMEKDVSKTYKLRAVDAAGNEIKDVVVNPAYINVNIPISKTKDVGVKVKTIGQLDPSFILESIKVLPERFEVTGSAAGLNLLQILNTEPIDLSKIKNNTTMDVKVLIPNELNLVDSSSNGLVKVEINLQKIVKKNISLDIKSINLDEKYDVKLAVIKNEIVVSAAEKVIDSLDLQKFSATLDLANLAEGEHSVPVKVTVPEGIELISAVPDKILVTITKKQTEGTTSDGN